jgi:methyl-accepting chemotaxis protein
MKEIWRTSSKIMVVVMLCASILSAAIGGLVLYQSGQVVEANVYKNLELTADNYASVFSDSTEKVENTLSSYLSSINGTMDYNALLADPDTYLKTYQDTVLVPMTKQFAVDNQSHFLGIYFDFEPSLPLHLSEEYPTYGVWYLDKNLNGEIERNSMELKKNFYPANEQMGWYYGAVEAGAGVWSKPYIDIYTGYYMISYTAPLYYGNRLIGVAGIDMTFESVKDIIEKFKVLDTGYAFLLSSDYNVIVAPGKKDVTENADLSDPKQGYRKLIDTIERGSSKSINIGKSTDGKVLSYGKMSNGYIFIIEVRSKEIFKDLNYIRTLIDTVILIGIILCAVVAYFLGKYIARPVDEAQRRIHRLSCQDLQKDTREVHFGRNSEGQKMIYEIESIRLTIERLILSLKDNLSQEELAREKLESIMNKLEIILERMQQSCNAGSGEEELSSFQLEESRRLFEQASLLVGELSAIHDRNKNLGSIYYLDEHFIQNNKNNKEGSIKNE